MIAGLGSRSTLIVTLPVGACRDLSLRFVTCRVTVNAIFRVASFLQKTWTHAQREASMTKRPSVIGSLSLMEKSPAAPDLEVATTKPARAKREGIVHTSIYVPRPVYQKLREIAFTQERKVHDIIMQRIDAALQKYGHPGTAALNAQTPHSDRHRRG